MNGLILFYLAFFVLAIVIFIYSIVFLVTVPKHLGKIAEALENIERKINRLS